MRYVILILVLSITACMPIPTPIPTPTPDPCIPPIHRTVSLGTFDFSWNRWDGTIKEYKVGNSKYTFKVEGNVMVVLLDPANKQPQLEMYRRDTNRIDVLVIPMLSRSTDGKLSYQFMAVAQRCGSMFFDDNSTKTN